MMKSIHYFLVQLERNLSTAIVPSDSSDKSKEKSGDQKVPLILASYLDVL